MKLLFQSKIVIPESGGLQEETTYPGIPCITLRPDTERPVTKTQGTNELVNLTNMEENVNLIIEGVGRVDQYQNIGTAKLRIELSLYCSVSIE
jgi:UDP-N-acetylglucosamine 2-epimerase (non-hydrolysing)